MEQQFILRLPEELKGIDFNEAKLTKISEKEVMFKYNGNTYPGIICRLPTIIESQKSINGKLYKVADLCTIIVIYNSKDIRIESEISKLEKSGITPPMENIVEFRRSILPPDNTEQCVAELLAEDAKAIRVEIIENEDSGSDIEEFAAELEKVIPTDNANEISQESEMKDIFDMGEEKIPTTETKSDKIEKIEEDSEDSELARIENKIKEKKSLLEKALNPILQKRFIKAISDLEKEYENKKKRKQ